MSDDRRLPEKLNGKESFSRQEFAEIMEDFYGLSNTQIAYDLQKRLDHGDLVRVGWGRYSLPLKRQYNHNYSEFAVNVANTIHDDYDGVNFQVFELIQLNDFMNHQMAHNTIFVTVENDLVDYVFDTLMDAYPGQVMLKPKLDEYYRYRQENEIVVGRLPSETPKGIREPWMSRLEKIMVDVFTDKLISKIVPEGEKQLILDGAFSEYLMDVNTMIRYAKRKGVEEKILRILTDHGKVALI